MFYIIDIAKLFKDSFIELSNKIQINHVANKEKYGIGITDADLLNNSIGFTLELNFNTEVIIDGDSFEGFAISIYLSFETIEIEKFERFIKVEIDYYKNTGFIIDKKLFRFSTYNNIEAGEKAIQDAVVFLKEIGYKLNFNIGHYLNDK